MPVAATLNVAVFGTHAVCAVGCVFIAVVAREYLFFPVCIF